MKSNTLKSILLIVFAVIALNFNNKSNFSGNQGVANFMNIMHKTMSQMEAVKLTGDPDYDFASLIRLHHKGGIEMLNAEIINGSDSATIKLAKKIKDNQEKDQSELENFISSHKIGESNSDFLNDIKESMQKAKDLMNKNMRVGGNVDKDFASLMAIHHEQGMDIAKAEVKHGKDQKMKDLAQKMVDDQNDEQKELLKMKNK